MPSIRHLQFRGMRPAVSRKSLPSGFAVAAHNAKLRDGELCPFLAPCPVEPCDLGQVHWLPVRQSIKCADGCIVPFYDEVCGDTEAVAVFPSEGSPWRCLPDGSEVPLVPPMPAVAPLATQVTFNDVDRVNGPDARTYVYTWVNQFGYESLPSPASPVLTSAYSDTFDLALQPPPADVVCVRIYRMVSAQDNDYAANQQVTSYQLVREIDPGTAFTDDVLQKDMDFGELLTINNCPPPEMDCVMELEAGYLIGWRGREVFLSERGEPHNWPEMYRLTLPFEIVGGDVYENSLFLGTTGHPFRVDVAVPQGDSDFAMIRVHRYKQNAPLRHPHAITCTEFGAAMSSVGGVWSLGQDRAYLATRARIEESVWDAEYDPTILEWQGGRLYGAGGPIGGFILGWQGAENQLDMGDLVTIDWNPSFAHAGSNGKLYYIEDGQVYEWDCGPDCMRYLWKSAVTRTPGEIHWAAVKVVGDFEDGKTATVRVMNDECGLYDEQLVTETGIYRVPCHPRGVHWQIEIEGDACICEVHVATSKAELTERATGGENAVDG